MAAGDDGDAGAWLVLVYRLPPKSSALKSLVRRRLAAAGAVPVSRACAVAPPGDAEPLLRRVRSTIAGAGGSAVLLRARALAGGPGLAAAFEARDRRLAARLAQAPRACSE